MDLKNGPKADVCVESNLPPITDVGRAPRHVADVPRAVIWGADQMRALALNCDHRGPIESTQPSDRSLFPEYGLCGLDEDAQLRRLRAKTNSPSTAQRRRLTYPQ